MGMSASQARLIQLEARMSDVEYEGQQINQQRLTLSNKMNEVYTQAMSMEVPTPPSKIDYPVNRYVGSLGSNNVNVKFNSGGEPIVTAPSKDWYATTSNVKNGTNVDYYVKEHTPTSAELLTAPPGNWRYDFTTTEIIDTKTPEEYENLSEDEQKNYVLSKNGNYEKLGPVNHNGTCTGDELVAGQTKGGLDLSPEDQFMCDAYPGVMGSAAEIVAAFDGAYDTSAMNNFYVMDGGTLRQSNSGDFTSTGQLKSNVTLYDKVGANDPGAIKVTSFEQSSNEIDGCTTKSVAELLNDGGEDAKNAISGLRNYVAAQEGTVPTDEYLASTYTALVDSNGKYTFVKTAEMNDPNNTTLERISPQYTTNAQILDTAAQLNYDTKGNIVSVTLQDGTVVDLIQEDGYDEVAYDKAYVEYEREKIKYDQEQNELNKQTSLYQQQDKKLELKLTRLDTERNALNTEIESVKKVIQDSTEKGFKTFSG